MEKLSRLLEAKLPDACWQECKCVILQEILQDKTTSRDNLKEKARNYTLNYLAYHPEISVLQKDVFASQMADEIEKDLEDHCFNPTPNAVLAARDARETIAERPEEKFIKLGK